MQLVIVDREAAILPTNPADSRVGAIEVRNLGMLAVHINDSLVRRLAVSAMTVQRMVADLADRLGATSGSQAGVKPPSAAGSSS